MALDFYDLQDTRLNHRLFSLDDRDMEAIEGYLLEYYKATDITFDSYSTTRLYQDHVNLIINLLQKGASKLPQKSQQSKHLAIIIDNFKQANEGLLAEGD